MSKFSAVLTYDIQWILTFPYVLRLSIYSTCKRISQKLLRNVVKFFDIMVNHDMTTEGFKVIRQNMEEIVLQGPNGVSDVRIVNVS